MKDDFELVLEKAISLKKLGKSDTQVAELFPEFREELIELLPTLSRLEAERANLIPSKSSLEKVLMRLPLSKPPTSVEANHSQTIFGGSLGMFKQWPLKAALSLGLFLVLGLGIIGGLNYLKVPSLPQPTNQLAQAPQERKDVSHSPEEGGFVSVITTGNVDRELEKTERIIQEDLSQAEKDIENSINVSLFEFKD
jgi:hypothetical protein